MQSDHRYVTEQPRAEYLAESPQATVVARKSTENVRWGQEGWAERIVGSIGTGRKKVGTDMGFDTSFAMEPQTIVALQSLQLADLLCAVPAFRSLRAAFPKAHIALIGLPWAEGFVNRFSRYLDEFIEFPGYPGFPEQPDGVIQNVFMAMRRRRFDLALQMHGSDRDINRFLTLIGARMTAGFIHTADHSSDEHRFIPYPEHLPETDRQLALLRHLGIPAHDHRLEFPLTDRDDATAFGLQVRHGLKPGSYVCLHPGGGLPSQRWDPHLFSLVGDRLIELGYRVVLIGTEAERSIAQDLMAHMRERATNLVGQTDLGTLAVVVSHSALLIANDTAVSLLASALQVPSVIVCVGSDPIRRSPHNRCLHRVLIGHYTTVNEVMATVHELEPLISRPHGRHGTAPPPQDIHRRLLQPSNTAGRENDDDIGSVFPL